MGISLYQLSAHYEHVFNRLADSDLPDEVIDDTLEGIEGELVEKGRNVAAFFLNLGAEIEAIKGAEARIAAHRKALENKQSRLKEYLKQNMSRCGITEIKANDGSFAAKLYIGRDEAVVIDDEGQLPKDYLREKVTYTADKTLIKSALNDGFDVPGAHVEKRDRLEIK